ncbi:MAG: Ig-like domain-containing protein [Acidobacteria bacterium]|nr:Ig-like domain-containing protein [Acidobacteriota bacterium]
MAMKRTLLLSLLAALAPLCFAQVDVGSGAPNDTIRQGFVSAFNRGIFPSLVKLPPIADVRTYGSAPGYIQEFNELNGTGKLALIRAHGNATPVSEGDPATDVFQVWAALYAYYGSVGVATAGYPIRDTNFCPAVANNTCTYQHFDRNYALFVYGLATTLGTNFYTRDPYYSAWLTAGGVSGLGPATSNEQSVTSVAGTRATLQAFTQGAFYNMTSGTLTGRLLTVKAPIYALYLSSGGHTGSFGFPTSDEITLADGRKRQSFERGSLEYTPGQPPVYYYPVSSLSLSVSASAVRLNAGATLTVTARAFAPNGTELTDRPISWSTSNGRVATVTAAGAVATITAVGGGNAIIAATTEGKTISLSVFVTAPCCNVGEGAPNGTITQTFLDAVTRNNLSLRLPAQDPVRRLGEGYVQEFLDANPASTARYLLAKPDRLAAVFVVAGDRLARYTQLGGPAGRLGYPISDATAAGRQLFDAGVALAGAPLRLVTGAILSEWFTLGYETGPAGLPVAEGTQFFTFTATGGSAQAFQNGAIYAAQTGSLTGKAFFVGGLIAARYAALSGPAGRLGMPAGDEYALEGRRRQEFEGGFIEYAPGDSAARETERARRPSVSATPTVVVAGSRVRLAIGGFEPDRTLRVTMTGSSEFQVNTQTGAFSWETFIPLNAASSAATVRASDGAGATAEGTFAIRALADARLQLSKVSGDMQVGAPGGLAPQPLRVSVRDENGSPVAGMAVAFNASPGAQVTPASAVTNAQGEAQTAFRLPSLEGSALVTAEAAKQVVTFSGRAAATSLRDFPKFTQSLETPLGSGSATISQDGALLTAAAAVLRYHQNRGELLSASGAAEPGLLNQFLTSFCALDAEGNSLCDGFLTIPGRPEQIVNLWRLGAFAGAALDVIAEPPTEAAVRDALAQGFPVIAALSLTADGQPAGSHFVVATGIAANAWTQIQDPNPALNRQTLGDYLLGFQAGGRQWKATLTGALRLAPQSVAQPGFLLTSSSSTLEVGSPAGPCGVTFEFPAAPARPAGALPASAGMFRFRACNGAQPLYQLDMSGSGVVQRASRTDWSDPGGQMDRTAGAGGSFALTRPATLWRAAPLILALAAGGVVNAASQTPALAPGSLVQIAGAGLSGSSGPTRADLDGQPLTLLLKQSFQLTAQLPLDLPPGRRSLRVESPFGSAEQTLEVAETAPAIFQSANAVLNQDGSVNSPVAPARRGQIIVVYCTGLGAVDRQGALSRARVAVTVLLNGAELTPAFAGLAPNLPGVYQVNVVVPGSTPPGLDQELRLRQQGAESNPAAVSIQ